MGARKSRKKKVLALAKKTSRFCELFIEQSDSWQSVEQGNRNLEKRETLRKKRKGPKYNPDKKF